MSFWIRFLSILLSIFMHGVSLPAPVLESPGAVPRTDRPAYEEYIKCYQGAVVSLQVFQRNEQDKDVLKAACSGFFYDEKGYFLSSASALIPFFGYNGRLNQDVIIKVLLRGEKEFREAKLLHVLERPDLAVLKTGEKDERFPAIPLNTRRVKAVGSEVFALAFPVREGKKLGFAPGYVTEYGPLNLSEELYPHRLVTSSCTFPLSYAGAPVFDSEGHFVGIVTAHTEREFTDLSGYYYAARELNAVLRLLVKNEPGSKVSLGAHFMSERDYASLREIYDFPAGVYVTEVIRDGSAYTAKMKEGDIILSINGRNVQTPEQLNELLIAARKGAEWKIRVFHSEDLRTEELVLYLQSDRAGKYNVR